MCGGPSPTNSLSGFRYFVTFVDDCSRATWVYMLKNKSDVFATFKSFHSMVLTQFNTKLQILWFNNGGKYLYREFSSFLDTSGITHQTTCPGTPKQNGIVELKNKHLLEIARALMFTIDVRRTFWSEAIQTAAYLINRMPSRVFSQKACPHVHHGCA